MGIRSTARIRIVRRGDRGPVSTTETLDDALESFLPDWLPADLINFRFLPKSYERYLALGAALRRSPSRILRKAKSGTFTFRGWEPEDCDSYALSEGLVKQLRLMNFSNRDLQMRDSVLSLDTEDAAMDHWNFTLRGEDAIDIELRVKTLGASESRETLLSAMLDTTTGMLQVMKRRTTDEGMDFLNVLLYLAKRSLDDGN
jgi:hypothetical protein